jgi:hypothetical protein
MENQQKDYNPFKLWGSWFGFILGLIILIFTSTSLNAGHLPPFAAIMMPIVVLNPIVWIDSEIAFLTLPVALFFWGWIIHVVFRLFNRRTVSEPSRMNTITKTFLIIFSTEAIILILGLFFWETDRGYNDCRYETPSLLHPFGELSKGIPGPMGWGCETGGTAFRNIGPVFFLAADALILTVVIFIIYLIIKIYAPHNSIQNA